MLRFSRRGHSAEGCSTHQARPLPGGNLVPDAEKVRKTPLAETEARSDPIARTRAPSVVTDAGRDPRAKDKTASEIGATIPKQNEIAMRPTQSQFETRVREQRMSLDRLFPFSEQSSDFVTKGTFITIC